MTNSQAERLTEQDQKMLVFAGTNFIALLAWHCSGAIQCKAALHSSWTNQNLQRWQLVVSIPYSVLHKTCRFKPAYSTLVLSSFRTWNAHVFQQHRIWPWGSLLFIDHMFAM